MNSLTTMQLTSFLAETFGECGRPKVAFQADTFGHSREQALLSSLVVIMAILRYIYFVRHDLFN